MRNLRKKFLAIKVIPPTFCVVNMFINEYELMNGRLRFKQ